MENIIRVGVGVYIFNQKNRVLLGLRKSQHGQGTWCPPSGHMEYGETNEQAALREVKEETGLELNLAEMYEVLQTMEGNFYAPHKHSCHPHTNRVKAALNMMTRTSAAHYKDFGVYMNSVDTGWITNEKPNPQNLGEEERKGQMTIDEVGGAMRILDPIITAVKGEKPVFGKLFKNYQEYLW